MGLAGIYADDGINGLMDAIREGLEDKLVRQLGDHDDG